MNAPDGGAVTIILAAGRGRRLGGAGKALIRLGGTGTRTLAARAMHAALEAGTHPILVLGHRRAEVVRTLAEEAPDLLARTTVAECPDWCMGLSASFRAGVAAACAVSGRTAGGSVDGAPRRCAMLLVDQPHVGAEALRRVLAAHRPGRIARGTRAGRDGHPVVLDLAEAREAARGAVGDEGARRHLRRQRGRIDRVVLDGVDDDADVDTPTDLARERARAGRPGR